MLVVDAARLGATRQASLARLITIAANLAALALNAGMEALDRLAAVIPTILIGVKGLGRTVPALETLDLDKDMLENGKWMARMMDGSTYRCGTYFSHAGLYSSRLICLPWKASPEASLVKMIARIYKKRGGTEGGDEGVEGEGDEEKTKRTGAKGQSSM